MKKTKHYLAKRALCTFGFAPFVLVSIVGAHAATEVYINEIQVSTTSTDWEFIELQGEPGTDLSDLSILAVESDEGDYAGTIDRAISLSGQTIPDDGFWVGISSAGSSQYGVDGDMEIANNSFENSTTTYLLVSDFTGQADDDLDGDNDGIFDLAQDALPWSSVLDAVNLRDSGSNDHDYGYVSYGPDGYYLPSGLYRCPDGPEGDLNNFLDFSSPDGTPGASNCGEAVPVGSCGDTYTPIYSVQGNGFESQMVGEVITTEGIVVGDFQDGKKGYYIQDAAGDGDATTSDGVFVYDTSLDVNMGDHVRVTGTVTEYYSLTEISPVDQVEICSSNNEVSPVEISLPVESIDSFEAYEGMLVNLAQELAISEYYNFGRYGELVLTTERQFQPTAIYEPGSDEAAALATANLLSRITLDDGRTTQNPDPAVHPNGYVFDLDNLFRGGDLVRNVAGVMDYSYGDYIIQPVWAAEYIPANPRPEYPEEVGGSIKVASFNVLNYFTTLDNAGSICGPEGILDCRGADTAEEFTRQHDKIVSALATLDADVTGLIEIENFPGDTPVATLVTGLNDKVGAGTYNYIATGAIGSDAIRVAFIYKVAAVAPVGNFAVLDSTTDSRFIDEKNRPVLAQTFQDMAKGGLVTVAVNHFKSKGSDCDDLGDPDTGDGSGNCNLTRTAAAESLVDWLETDPTGSGSTNYLIIGDLNSNDKEMPIQTILTGADNLAGSEDDYIDLLEVYQGEYAYSYVFDGQLGYLDYALASSSLATNVTGATAWHINTDEPSLIDYDMSYKKDAQDLLYAPDPYRSSDHDAVVVGLELCEDVDPSIEVSVTPNTLTTPNHKYVLIEATVDVQDNLDTSPEFKLVSVSSNEPDNGKGDGNTTNDIVVVDDTHIKLRAERSGAGSGRIYTLIYEALDSCGNSVTAEAVVTVPHSRKKKNNDK